MGFFRRFGSHFNLYTDAVAIGSGGICPKKSVCQFEEDVLAPKLCVQDISTLRCLLSLLELSTRLSCQECRACCTRAHLCFASDSALRGTAWGHCCGPVHPEDCAPCNSHCSEVEVTCARAVRDVASGSKRITEVSEAFHSSAETLQQQAKTYQVLGCAWYCHHP